MKCPSCGYDTSKKYNPSRNILELVRKRGVIARDLLKKVSNKIFENIQTDDNIYKYFLFLQSINNIKDRVINKTIRIYLYKKPYLTGKGFAYLKKMITNANTNSKKLLRNEYKSIGKPPTIINKKETK